MSVYCHLCCHFAKPTTENVGEFGFSFPKSQVELEKWCSRAIGVQKEELGLEEGKRIGLCHLHFKDEDILFHKTRHGLKPGAIPSLSLASPPPTTPSAICSPEKKRYRLLNWERETESQQGASSSQKTKEKSSSGSPQKSGSGSHGTVHSLSSGNLWSPLGTDDESESDEELLADDFITPALHTNYIISFLKLENDICRFCPICAQDGSAVGMSSRTWSEKGMALILCWTCLNGHDGKWESQSVICVSGTQNVYDGNLSVAAATELCGQTYQPMSEWAEVLDLAFPCRASFHLYSRKCLLPTIRQTWESEKESLCKELVESPERLSVSADGQFESPGFSSTHGIVTFMEKQTGKVVDFTVLKKNEEGVGSSHAIEKAGFEIGLCSILAKIFSTRN